jgi:hypothetical protein
MICSSINRFFTSIRMDRGATQKWGCVAFSWNLLGKDYEKIPLLDVHRYREIRGNEAIQSP